MSNTTNINKQMSRNKQRIKAKQEQKRIGMKTYVNEGQLNLKVKLSMQEYQRLQDAALISGVHMRECLKRGISLYHDFIMRAYEKHKAEVAAAQAAAQSNTNMEVATDGNTNGQSESVNTEGAVASEQSPISNSTESGGTEKSVDTGDGT